jgi:hypothetical protein
MIFKMNTHPETFVDVLAGCFGSSQGLFRSPPKKYEIWLRHKRVPAWLRRHLVTYALSRDLEVGVVWLYAPSAIRRWNDEYPLMIRRGFLQVGSALNGDPLVVQFARRSGKTGYLSHELLWSDEPEDPREHFLPVADSFGAFLARAVQIGKCPVDSCDMADPADNEA